MVPQIRARAVRMNSLHQKVYGETNRGGSMRGEDYDALSENGIAPVSDRTEYEFYLDLRKYGTVPRLVGIEVSSVW